MALTAKEKERLERLRAKAGLGGPMSAIETGELTDLAKTGRGFPTKRRRPKTAVQAPAGAPAQAPATTTKPTNKMLPDTRRKRRRPYWRPGQRGIPQGAPTGRGFARGYQGPQRYGGGVATHHAVEGVQEELRRPGAIGTVVSSGAMVRARRQAEKEALLKGERERLGVAKTEQEQLAKQQAAEERAQGRALEMEETRQTARMEAMGARGEQEMAGIEARGEVRAGEIEAGQEHAIALQKMQDEGTLTRADDASVQGSLKWQRAMAGKRWKFSAQDQREFDRLKGERQSVINDASIGAADQRKALKEIDALMASFVPEKPESPWAEGEGEGQRWIDKDTGELLTRDPGGKLRVLRKREDTEGKAQAVQEKRLAAELKLVMALQKETKEDEDMKLVPKYTLEAAQAKAKEIIKMVYGEEVEEETDAGMRQPGPYREGYVLPGETSTANVAEVRNLISRYVQ